MKMKTLEENNVKPPEGWKKEIESFRKDIIRWNTAPKFRSGVFFTEKGLQSISEDTMDLAMKKAEEKLKKGWPDVKISENLEKAQNAEDLGIIFLPKKGKQNV